MLRLVPLLTKGRGHSSNSHQFRSRKQNRRKHQSSSSNITLRRRLRVPIVTCHHITRSPETTPGRRPFDPRRRPFALGVSPNPKRLLRRRS
eukprot:g71404.t1